MKAAAPALFVTNPPAVPPFLSLMKTRREDIRTSISHKSTSQMFGWISALVLSLSQSLGITPLSLISIPRRTRSTQTHGQRWQATPLCLIRRDFRSAGLDCSHAVICPEAWWRLCWCSGAEQSFSKLDFRLWAWQQWFQSNKWWIRKLDLWRLFLITAAFHTACVFLQSRTFRVTVALIITQCQKWKVAVFMAKVVAAL